MGLCVAALCAPASASAATYTVDTTADPTSDNECTVDCTLREAVFVAGAADTVNVPPGTYTLQQGQLSVDTVIVGAGARTTTIRAAPQTRVISIPGEARASITGVTITGGSAISAAAAQQGGGILIGNSAVLLLFDSAVVGNSANGAGGIMVNGALGMARSTVSGNVATSSAAGGIAITSGDAAMLTNSTVSGNRAETPRLGLGGGIWTQGTLTLDSATVANNRASGGGGVYQAAMGQNPTAATLRDAIVAGNVGGDCGGTAAIVAAWQGDHNLDQDGSCGFSAVGDKPGVNPLLGALTNNGGPTNTHALAANSPAVNAGDRRTARRPTSAPSPGPPGAATSARSSTSRRRRPAVPVDSPIPSSTGTSTRCPSPAPSRSSCPAGAASACCVRTSRFRWGRPWTPAAGA